MIADIELWLRPQLQGIGAIDNIRPACLERMPQLRLLLEPRLLHWSDDCKSPGLQALEEATGVAPVQLGQLRCLQTTDSELLQRLQAPQLSFLHVLYWPLQVCSFLLD